MESIASASNLLLTHPAPFPEEIAERAIKLLTYRRDLVVDPFNGSGTTTAIAAHLQRRFIGIDRSPRHCVSARRRLAAVSEQIASKANGVETPNMEKDVFAAPVIAA